MCVYYRNLIVVNVQRRMFDFFSGNNYNVSLVGGHMKKAEVKTVCWFISRSTLCRWAATLCYQLGWKGSYHPIDIIEWEISQTLHGIIVELGWNLDARQWIQSTAIKVNVVFSCKRSLDDSLSKSFRDIVEYCRNFLLVQSRTNVIDL